MIKVGDLVESCCLMPGVVMKIDGTDIEVRKLHYLNEQLNGKDWSCCSLNHCGVVLLNPEQAMVRLLLGKEKLTELWDKHQGDQDEYHKELDSMIPKLNELII
jgi:hypothetical protein